MQVLSAYVHPCASNERLLLVDSDIARQQTLAQQLSAQSWLLVTDAQRGIAVTIEKPHEDLEAALVEGVPPRGPTIPDFIVTGRAAALATERCVIVETGLVGVAYRERKLRIHRSMSQAVDGAPVVKHDFHEPGERKQRWQDEKFSAAVLATVKDKPFGWPPKARPSLTAARHGSGIVTWSGRKNGFAEVEHKNASICKSRTDMINEDDAPGSGLQRC